MIEPNNTALDDEDVEQKHEHHLPEKTKQSLERIKKRRAARKVARYNKMMGRRKLP